MHNQIALRKDEIFDLIASDKIPSAITRLLDFIRDFADESDLQSEAIVVSSNYSKFTRQERQELIDPGTAGRERNKIINQILDIVKDVVAYFKSFLGLKGGKAPQPPVAAPAPPPATEAPAPQAPPAPPPVPEAAAPRLPDLPPLQAAPEADPPPAPLPAQPQQAAEPLVCITQGLTKVYRKSGFQLGPIDIELAKNQILGVVGENGNGKTTLFKLLTGEIRNDAGMLDFPAMRLRNGRPASWIKLKQQIAYVQQELPPWQGSLINNLHYEAALHGIRGKANKKAVEFVVYRLGLVEHLSKKWDQLSGGFKLRFALARALVKKPKLLVLDEPLANLDIKAQALVLQDLRNLCNSIHYPVSMIVSSQHLDEVEFVSDKVLFIRNGNPVFYGTKDTLGQDRQHNFFEIQTTLGKDELTRRLTGIQLVDVVHDAMYVQLVTSLETTPEMVIKAMLNNNMPVGYFRDISKATKKLFI